MSTLFVCITCRREGEAPGEPRPGARLLAEAADGLMPWRGRPEPLKRGLIARMPPLDFTEDHS